MNQVTAGLAPIIYSRDQHQLSRSKIDPDALKIMYRLTRHGHKAYLVGGGVRDVLLGKNPKDFDIATDATPRQVKSLFRNSRIIGRRFKLVHIYFNSGKIIEVSTFRDSSEVPEVEEESTSESALVARPEDNVFGTEATDAIRRDLTINGLFYDASTFSIIDYVGGIPDLENGVVRTIGDPETRFIEDPVRLIRVVRHAARNQFVIEPSCHAALSKNVHLIAHASQVRVFEEFKKDLTSGAILPILRLLHETGLLTYLLPALATRGDELLADGSHLPICLDRIDSCIQQGEGVSATIVLSVLALYSPLRNDSHGGDFFAEVHTYSDIEEQVRLCFSVLMVPRKERERVSNLLWMWFRIQSGGTARIRKHLETTEIKQFAEALLGESSEEFLAELLRPHPERGPGTRLKRRRRRNTSMAREHGA